MSQNLTKEYLTLGRNPHQIIRDGTFATRREFIENELFSHHIVEHNMRIQGQLRKLHALLIHERIPDFYGYFFMGQLSGCSEDRIEDSLNRQLQLIKSKQCHYHGIMRTLKTREICLKSLRTCVESLFENNDQSVTNKFKEEVQHHRKFTAMVIEQIKDWKNYLLAIREGVFENEHIAFYYMNQDYLLKILNDTDFISQSFLSTKVVFSHKQDPFLMRPFTENQSDDPYVQMFSYELVDQKRYIKCLEYLSEERAEYLKRKVAVRQDKIKEIEKIYQTKQLSQRIFVNKPSLFKRGKNQITEAPIDFIDESSKPKPESRQKQYTKTNLSKESRLFKQKQLQVKGERIKKIKEMEFGTSSPLINIKKFSTYQQPKPHYPIQRSVSLSFLKRSLSKFPKVEKEKEQTETDFEVLLRKKELQVLQSDSVKRRSLSTIKLQDRLSERKQLLNKDGADELQKIIEQIDQTTPYLDESGLKKSNVSKAGKSLLQHNQEVMLNLRKNILKQMQSDESAREKEEKKKEEDRDNMQRIIQTKLKKMTVEGIAKEKEKWVEGKDVLAHQIGKSSLFGFDEPISKKSQKLTELQEQLKHQMQLKWLREVQQELAHKEAMHEQDKTKRKLDEQREKELEIAIRKKQQEEKFDQIEKEERMRAMRIQIEEEDKRKREIQQELAKVIHREKQKLQQFSGEQKALLEIEMKEVMKNKLLMQLKKEKSQYITEKQQEQKRKEQQEAHKAELRSKMAEEFQVEQALQRHRQRQQKARKLKLVAQKMDHIEQKLDQSKVKEDTAKLQALKKSISDFPDFKKPESKVIKESSKKMLRQQFQLQLFAFNRPENLTIQQDNFLIKDFKTQLDNEENLNKNNPQEAKDDPKQPSEASANKQKQKKKEETIIMRGTSLRADRDLTNSTVTDKFTRFSQFDKEDVKKEESISASKIRQLGLDMSPEEYHIYMKKKMAIDAKRIVPDPNIKEEARLKAKKMLDNFEKMESLEDQTHLIESQFINDRKEKKEDKGEKEDKVEKEQKMQEASQESPQKQRRVVPQQSPKRDHKKSQDLSEVMKLTVHSKMSSVKKKKFVTSDEESFEDSPRKSKKQKKQKQKQKYQAKRQKDISVQEVKQKQVKIVAHERGQYRQVAEEKLDEYLITHFKSLPKLIRKLNLLKKDELLKTIQQCKTIKIIQIFKAQELIGIAFAFQNENKQNMRSMNILHIGSYAQSNMIKVLIFARQLLFNTDPCMQITVSMYFDKEDEEQYKFIKEFETQFDPYGAIFQKKISTTQIERKHVMRRMIGEEPSVVIKDKNSGQVKITQHLFAHLDQYSLGVNLSLDGVQKGLGGWTHLGLFLSRFGSEEFLAKELTSDVKEEEKNIKHLAKMAMKLQDCKTTDIQYAEFMTPFEANLRLVEEGVELIKCDPKVQETDIPIIWSKLNFNFQPVLPFVSTIATFQGPQNKHTASYLRYHCTKGSKVIKLKSSLYSSVITVIPCKPSNYKLLIMDAMEFDSLQNVSFDLYLKLFLVNLSQNVLNSDEHIWIPQVSSTQMRTIEEGNKFGFKNEFRSRIDLSYVDYVDNSVVYAPTHRDMFVTPPFIMAVLNSEIEKITEGSPIFAERIDLPQMLKVVKIQNPAEQSDF